MKLDPCPYPGCGLIEPHRVATHGYFDRRGPVLSTEPLDEYELNAIRQRDQNAQTPARTLAVEDRRRLLATLDAERVTRQNEPLTAALDSLRDHGYQPMYNGRPSCPFCENFVDEEETHRSDCVLLAERATHQVAAPEPCRAASSGTVNRCYVHDAEWPQDSARCAAAQGPEQARDSAADIAALERRNESLTNELIVARQGVASEHGHADEVCELCWKAGHDVAAQGPEQARDSGGLREAVERVLAEAEPDDNFEGEYIDYLIPANAFEGLRAALSQGAAHEERRCKACGSTDIGYQYGRPAGAAHEERGLDAEILDAVVDELRSRGYVIPEASTIASTYARHARATPAPSTEGPE